MAPTVAVVILMLAGFPLVTADANNHFAYSGAVQSPYSNSGSSTVTYSNDGTFAAVGFHRSVGIFDISSRTFVRNIDVGDGVRSIAFSGDDSIMFVGLESPMMETLAVALFHTDDWQRFGVVDDGLEVDSIAIFESEQMFAAANEVQGANEYPFDDPAHESAVYEGVHTERVTCVDFSPSGNHLVTGSEDGSIVVWNRSNQTVHLSWLSDDPIEDCAFSPMDGAVTWVTGSIMQVRALLDGEFITTMALNGPAKQFSWNEAGDELWVLSEISSPVLQVFDTNDLSLVNTFDLGHNSVYFSLSPSDDEFIVATLLPIIAIYSDHHWRPGYGQPGDDGDMDGIPDSLDSDEDGDGIGNDFEYVCNEGHDCEIYPNMDYVRSIDISFTGSTMTIQDSVQLNSSQSAPLRILAAASVNSDGLVDDGEAMRMERMLCGGTDHEAIIAAWMDAVELERTAVVSQSVICDSKFGLIDTEKTDSKTRIVIRWFIEVELSNQIPRPFNLTFKPGISPPASTIAMATPSTPIRLKVWYEGTIQYVSGPIYPTDLTMTIHLASPAPPAPTFLEISGEWLTENYWVPLVVIVVVTIVAVVTIRRRNRILFDYGDEEDQVVSRRRKSRQPRRQPADDDSPVSSSGKIQPSGPPTRTQSRPQPNRPPPDKRAVRRVRKTPGTVMQTGDAPEGESWDYVEHGAYWDSDDPDRADPYGEAKEFHEEEIDLKVLAEEMVDGSTPVIEEDDGADSSEFADALSQLTGASQKVDSDSEEESQTPPREKPPKTETEEKSPKKRRRAPKRRKKS